MYLICYGTRPEWIKLKPLIDMFTSRCIVYKTLFSGQHESLLGLSVYPDIRLERVMEEGQSLNTLISKIISKMDIVFRENGGIKSVIVQGDTSTSLAIALAAFHHKLRIIHVEAGLRTHSKFSPFPEEINRVLISRLADVHLCPTMRALENLEHEGITTHVYNVGNTVVDIFESVKKTSCIDLPLADKRPYILVTLHRRENRGDRMNSLWAQLNTICDSHTFVYVTHPSLPQARESLSSKILCIDPQDYIRMVHLITNSVGIITDSGGLQEEAVCAGKRVLICRDTTERPETTECGLGRLIDTDILNNISFLDEPCVFAESFINPFGRNVCEKITDLLIHLDSKTD